MTRSLRRIDWAALGANVGSALLFTLLALGPFLVGAHYRLWLLGLAIGIILGLYFYLRRELQRTRPRRRRDPISTLTRRRR
jgi:uncharacterized membrane protein YciS (DUF1049 family)